MAATITLHRASYPAATTARKDHMVVQPSTDAGTYLLLDDQGSVIGRIERTVLALEGTPPSDTVLLQPPAA